MTGALLVMAGGAIFVVLGVLHGVYTFLDLGRPRRLAPANAELIEEMRKTRVRLRKDARNFWLSYLGFNFSHSLGALFFGAVTIATAALEPSLVGSPLIMMTFVAVALIYALLSHFFWFIVPLASSVLAALLFASAFFLELRM